jgi:FkbM family methyltransferase
MGFLSTLGRKMHTASLIASYYSAFRKGVGPYEMEFFDKPWFTAFGLGTVIDIGANTGQFATLVSNLLPDARLFSFEPIPECHRELVATMRGHSKFKSFNVGLGELDGRLRFEKNEFTPSSSFLALAKDHRHAFPFASKTQSIEVQVRRLDSFQNELTIDGKLLVKIDTQGYELPVIKGGTSILLKAHMVIVEISFDIMYERQALFDEIYKSLRDLGLRLSGISGVTHDPISGKCLQCDGIFLREDGVSAQG